MPDHAKLQLAGNIGFLSPGVGYQVAGGRIHLDLLFGWVPASIAGDSIYSATGKITYAPLRMRVGARWRLEPFRPGVLLARTFGSQYFTRPPDRYPSGYYDLPTAWYSGVAIGASLTREDRRRDGHEVSLYIEHVALTMAIRDWCRNRDVIDPSDVVSMAVGVMVGF